MPGDYDLDFGFQDEINAPKNKRPAQPKGMPPKGTRVGNRRKKSHTTSIIVLAVEMVVFVALIILFFVIKSGIDETDSTDTSTGAVAEGSQEAGAGPSKGVNVDSDSFTLQCTKVQLANDENGNPAALIYFTFVNKTDTPLSMSEVYPPSLKQNGQDCANDITLADYPTEYANKDMKVSGGQSVDCCYAFSIYDLTSPLSLTIHDNYSTFTDIGTTEIHIS